MIPSSANTESEDSNLQKDAAGKENLGRSQNKDGLLSRINFGRFVSYKRDIAILLLLIAVFLSLNIALTSGMKQLPSPIYGGDYYYQMGCINHMRYGGSPLTNCNLISNTPGYFPFFGFVEASFANTFNLDTFRSEILLSSLILIVSVALSYIIFRKIFSSRAVAVLGTLLFVTVEPILKYTEFGAYVVNPLFLLAVYLFYKNPGKRNAAILGLTAGLDAITHSVLFPASVLTIFCLLLYTSFEPFFKRTEKAEGASKASIPRALKSLLVYGLIALMICIPISLIYWYGPLFEHQMKTSPHYLEWNGPGDMSKSGLQIKTLTGILGTAFFDFGSIQKSLVSLLSLAGLAYIILFGRLDRDRRFIPLLFLVVIALSLSYFVTMPLMNIHFVPDYMFYVFGKAVSVSFALFGLVSIVSLSRKLLDFPIEKTKIVLASLLSILALVGMVMAANDYTQSRWYGVSQNAMPDYLLSLQNFVLQNTGVNDVFITTKETGFMLNALTGRKVVASRRAQNDAFENMDPREMDEAVILYGNDTDAKKTLIEKYSIKYLYWDYYWIQSEYTFDKEGKLTSWFDPLIAFKNDTYMQVLEGNNVTYFVTNSYVDPTLKTEFHPTFDLIFVSPQNYYAATHPWNPNLDDSLKEVWNYTYEGQKIAALYQIEVR